jgi:hypothetical protein
MYEHRTQRPIPARHFVRRFIAHAGFAALLVAGSLLAGMIGYHIFEGLPWRDAFLNAAMLLGGMGPVDAPHTNEGKLFAGVYALYAGLIFIMVAGLMIAPVFHRMLHIFHWEDRNKG